MSKHGGLPPQLSFLLETMKLRAYIMDHASVPSSGIGQYCPPPHSQGPPRGTCTSRSPSRVNSPPLKPIQ